MKEVRRAWGAHLKGFPWDHFVTLTFRFPVSVDGAAREFLHGWVRRVARSAQRAIPCFYGVELGAGGYHHVHALTACTVSLTCECLRKAWKAGQSKIEQYDANLGAAWYVTKGVLGKCEWYDVTRRTPPRSSSPHT